MTIINDPLTSYYTTLCVSITEFKLPLLLHVLRESLFYKFRSIKNVKGVLNISTKNITLLHRYVAN